MKSYDKISRILVVFFMFAYLPGIANDGVKINSTIDLVSLYNWRAVDFGDSPALQPRLSVFWDNLDFTVWGSQSIIARKKRGDELVAHNEIDIWLKYRINTNAGTFIPSVLDYFFPYKQKGFFDYDGAKDGKAIGAHGVNLSLTYLAPNEFPLRLFLEYSVHNDPDKSMYMEMGVPFTVDEIKCEALIGVCKGLAPGGRTSTYGITENKLAVCNLAFSATKNIKITDSFSIPFTSSFVIQPYTEEAWLVFKAKL